MLVLITCRLNANSAKNHHHLHLKSVSLASLIVSTWALLLTSVTFTTLMPVATVLGTSASGSSVWDNSNAAVTSGSGSFSNITLLDLYPELKDYLVKKALAQLASSSTENSAAFSDPSALYPLQQQQVPSYPLSSSSWSDSSSSSSNNPYEALSSYLSAFGSPGTSPLKQTNPRYDQEAENSDFYNYQTEVLKHLTPLGSSHVYDTWKFPPAASVQSPSYGWNPSWETFPSWCKLCLPN